MTASIMYEKIWILFISFLVYSIFWILYFSRKVEVTFDQLSNYQVRGIALLY
jgi:low temperature requirement protein LtrA